MGMKPRARPKTKLHEWDPILPYRVLKQCRNCGTCAPLNGSCDWLIDPECYPNKKKQ